MKFTSSRMSAATLGLLLTLPSGLAAATASVAAPVPAVVPATTIADSFTKQTFDLINAERAKVGSRPFVWNQKIADVSQDWAKQLGVATMDTNFDFATIHRADAGGNEIPAGATWYRENIGFNFSPAQLVNWWMNSPGHKAAMLDPRGTDAGIGYVVPTTGPYAGWHLMVSNMAAYPTTQIPSSPAPPTAPTTISYEGHVQKIGWQSSVSNGETAGSVGQALRLEALRFSTSGQTVRAHIQDTGWQNYSTGATTIGTTGLALRMEAIQIKSTIAGETIRCQAHVQNIGWMPEVGDGEVCGTTGQGLRLEAVRFRVVRQ
ncbi:CAP domain-containing protein [Arthrobacter sp. FW306-05-C]|uniref:CAP domain-containing protein n=1 Tax=unclassified Arthrobacter TaxID=235627 RepID=UPI001EEF8A2F|nr:MULTISPECIES: CAP domain-containing protein [unclassified Arthrobacter]UKA68570.1 CAP domain-containing protein [Arthrobacter sp. FW306-05-C]UKA77204.1 CAP domain-containing protein [Arthrobacter sp. FW306-07-I]